jgi:hypothetical protein
VDSDGFGRVRAATFHAAKYLSILSFIVLRFLILMQCESVESRNLDKILPRISRISRMKISLSKFPIREIRVIRVIRGSVLLGCGWPRWAFCAFSAF